MGTIDHPRQNRLTCGASHISRQAKDKKRGRGVWGWRGERISGGEVAAKSRRKRKAGFALADSSGYSRIRDDGAATPWNEEKKKKEKKRKEKTIFCPYVSLSLSPALFFSTISQGGKCQTWPSARDNLYVLQSGFCTGAPTSEV